MPNVLPALVYAPFVAALADGRVVIAGGESGFPRHQHKTSVVFDPTSLETTRGGALPWPLFSGESYRYDALGGLIVYGRGPDASSDCDITFSSATNAWVQTGSCRRIDRPVLHNFGLQLYPRADGTPSGLAYGYGGEVLTLGDGGWGTLPGTLHRMLADGLLTEDHRLVVSDAASGEVLVCSVVARE